MKRYFALALLLVVACKERTETPAATSTFAPPPPTQTAQQPAPSSAESLVPRVTVAELNGMVKSAEVTIIDVRAANDYIGGHIPGSLHIPLSFLEQEAAYLPRGKRIVTYCT